MVRRLAPWLAFVIVSILLGGLLAGCPQRPATTPAKKPEIVTVTPGKITFGIAPDYPPFEMRQGPGFAGFDVDLAREISRRLNKKATFRDITFDNLIVAVRQHKVDAVISAMTITEERAALVAFSDPYFNAGQVIVVRAGDRSVAGPSSLKGKTVGVGLGTTGEKFARERLKGASVRTFKQSTAAFAALRAGTVDAVINDNAFAEAVAAKSPQRYRIVGELLSQELYGIAIGKNDTALLEAVNKELADLKADGGYQRLYDKWLGANAP